MKKMAFLLLAVFIAAAPGASNALECMSNEDCLPTEFCLKAVGDCGGLGVCEPVPTEACPLFWIPVCGCDGHTYGNDCEAAQARTSLAAVGESCPAPPPPAWTNASQGTFPDMVRLNWEDVDVEAGYRVYRADAPGGPYYPIGETRSDLTIYQDLDGCGIPEYYYQVTAFSDGGESPPSPEAHGFVLNLPPVADAGGPYGMDTGADLPLDGSGSYDPNASCGDSIVSYAWDLDLDGQYDDAAGSSPTVPWADLAYLGLSSPGAYTIALRATDTFGASGTDTATLNIYLNEPAACFTADPNPAACGQTVSFDGSCSSHGRPDRSIVSFEWDFDYDGSFTADAAGISANHAYPVFGTFTAALRVTDNNVPARTDIQTIIIDAGLGNLAPIADAGGPYFTVAGHELFLDASGSSDPNGACGDYITDYRWDLNGDGLFEDAFGVSVGLNWEEIETMICNGTCSMDQTYPIRLKASDTLGLDGIAEAAFAMTYRLFLDKFSDGSRDGDPDWAEVSGNWKVVAHGPSKQFASVFRRNNKAVVQGIPDLDPISCGCFRTRIELTDQFKKKANGTMLFCYQDNENYRYVRLVKKPGSRGSVIIGQVGDPAGAGEEGGIRAQKLIGPRRLRLNRRSLLRVDVYPGGLVNVYINDMSTPVLSHAFSDACGGKVGYQAVKAKTYFDNFSAWDERVLP